MLVPGEVWEPGPCQLLEFPSTGERTIFLQHKSGFPFDLCRSLGTNTFPATLLSPSLELAWFVVLDEAALPLWPKHGAQCIFWLIVTHSFQRPRKQPVTPTSCQNQRSKPWLFSARLPGYPIPPGGSLLPWGFGGEAVDTQLLPLATPFLSLVPFLVFRSWNCSE